MALKTNNTDALILGVGTMKIGGTDVGAFKNASISISREKREHLVGLPQTPDKTWIIRESAQISAVLEEIDKEQLQWVFGNNFDGSTLVIGGVQTLPEYTVEITLQRDDGTVIIGAWRAQPGDSVDWGMPDDDIQGLPITLTCLQDPTTLGYLYINLITG